MNDFLSNFIKAMLGTAIDELKQHIDTRLDAQHQAIVKLQEGGAMAAKTVTADSAEAADTAVKTEPKATEKKAAAGKGKAGAKGKATSKKAESAAVDLTPYRQQVADLLEWLVDPEVGDAKDEVETLLEGFDVTAEPEISDEQYVEFYNAVYDLADEHIDLEDTPRIEA